MPIAETAFLPCEYAKYKNRLWLFRPRHTMFEVAVFLRSKAAMSDESPERSGVASVERRPLTPAAQRALVEAEARRQVAAATAKLRPREFQGPKGPEPTRYGDWENKGIATDF